MLFAMVEIVCPMVRSSPVKESGIKVQTVQGLPTDHGEKG
eukprot:XP_001708921.1 Hypothetical protein GL50803_28283 [Giardia lamblia ATCC 50803]